MRRARLNAQRGVTLTELMIAVAIVGILAAIAYPSYQAYRLRAHRAAAIGCITDVRNKLERLYTRRNRYTEDLTALGYSGLSGGRLPCGENDEYLVGLDPDSFTGYALPAGCAASNCFAIEAQATGNQVKDGNLILEVYHKAAGTSGAARPNVERRIRIADGVEHDGWK